MSKIKVIVCGTKFGQFYIEALHRYDTGFKLSGILSNGSNQSKVCSDKYNVPLYTNISDIPKDIKLAFVIIRSDVMGGSGTDVIIELLKRGINVVAEQPLHVKDIQKCVKEALKNNVLFRIANIYKNMETIKLYKEKIIEFIPDSEITNIEVTVSNQIVFSLIEVLEEIFGDELMLLNSDEIKPNMDDSSLICRIGSKLLLLKILNRVDAFDPDNTMPYMLNIKTFTNYGTLELYELFGPIIWKPMVKVAHNYFTAKEVNVTLQTNVCYMEELYSNNSFEEIFSKYWINSIKSTIINIKQDFSKGEYLSKQDKHCYQRMVENGVKWNAIGNIIGYPHLSLIKREDSNITSRIIKTFNVERATNTGDISIKLKECSFQEIKLQKRILDIACLESVYYNLFKINNFIINEEIKISNIFKIIGGDLKRERVLKRWLKILEKEKYIVISEEYIKFIVNINEDKMLYNWKRAKKFLIPHFTDEVVVDYYMDHSREFINILSGNLNPMLLLFPNGDDKIAVEFYRQNSMEKILAKEISKHICDYVKKAKRKIRILEIGAGTGATSEYIFSNSDLTNNNCEYIFSDASQYFLNNAKRKYAYEYIKFKKIDFNKSFMEQKIFNNSFDIVISAGALNNSIDTKVVVENIFNLVKSGGLILITEPVGEHYEIALSQSFLMNIPIDERYESNITFLNLNQWVDLLSQTGFITNYWPDETNPLSGLNKYLFMVRKE